MAIYQNEFDATMSLIRGKWKIKLLYELDDDNCRFNALQRALGDISHKTLTTQLRELEAAKLITRHEFNEVPPHVEYHLTSLGRTLIPVLDTICDWGLDHVDHNEMTDLLCTETELAERHQKLATETAN